jgi:hypothetical protein
MKNSKIHCTVTWSISSAPAEPIRPKANIIKINLFTHFTSLSYALTTSHLY